MGKVIGNVKWVLRIEAVVVLTLALFFYNVLVFYYYSFGTLSVSSLRTLKRQKVNYLSIVTLNIIL